MGPGQARAAKVKMVRIIRGYPDVIEGWEDGENRDQDVGRAVQGSPEFRLKVLGAGQNAVRTVQNRGGPQASAPGEHRGRRTPDKGATGDKTYHHGR